MNKYLLNAKLAHLSEGEVDLLINRYYEGEKIASLIAEFNIDCKPNTFAGILPFVIHAEQKCPNCGGIMGRRLSSKSTYKYEQNVLECSHCDHKDTSRCACNGCKKARLDEEVKNQQKQKTLISQYADLFEYVPSKLGAKDITFRAAVYLLALIRTCEMNEDGSYGEISRSAIPLTPNKGSLEDMLNFLLGSKLIGPSKNSALKAFTFEYDVITSIDFSLIDWKLNIINPELLISEIEDYGLNGNWPKCWSEDDVDDLRRELALAECKEFYEHCLSQRSFRYVDGPAIDSMLLNLLRDYSVTQCCYFIWKGAQQASDFKIRSNVNSKHAANYMSGACQRWADKARSENWEIKGFGRNFDLPRSMLSYVLYDVMLKIGEKGFTEPISKFCLSSE